MSAVPPRGALRRRRPRPPYELRAARIKAGLSIQFVADHIDRDRAFVSRVERGEARPSVETLYRMALVLGLHQLAEQLTPYVHADSE